MLFQHSQMSGHDDAIEISRIYLFILANDHNILLFVIKSLQCLCCPRPGSGQGGEASGDRHHDPGGDDEGGAGHLIGDGHTRQPRPDQSSPLSRDVFIVCPLNSFLPLLSALSTFLLDCPSCPPPWFVLISLQLSLSLSFSSSGSSIGGWIFLRSLVLLETTNLFIQ